MDFNPDDYLKEPFNPDTYLSEPKVAFNPDAYLAEQAPTPAVEDPIQNETNSLAARHPIKQDKAGILSSAPYVQAFAQMGNVADKFGSALAAPFMSLEGQDELFKGMEDREKQRNTWSTRETTLPAKIAGGLVTFLPQTLQAGMNIPATKMDLLKMGEDGFTATMGAGITTVGVAVQAIPIIGPTLGKWGGRVIASFALNATQQHATDLAIQTIVTSREAKEAYEPSLEKDIVSGAMGSAIHTAVRFSTLRQEAKVAKALKGKLAEAEVGSREKQAEAVHLYKEIDDTQRKAEALSNPENQQQLPFTNSVEDIAAVRSTTEPQQDMFVNQQQEGTPAALALQATQEKLQRLLAKKNTLEEELPAAKVIDEIDRAWENKTPEAPVSNEVSDILRGGKIGEEALAWAKRNVNSDAKQRGMDVNVGLLQQRFENPSTPKSQRGGIDFNTFMKEATSSYDTIKDKLPVYGSRLSFRESSHQNPGDYAIARTSPYEDEKGSWRIAVDVYNGDGSFSKREQNWPLAQFEETYQLWKDNLPTKYSTTSTINAKYINNPELRNTFPKSQRGAIDMSIFEPDYFKIKELYSGHTMTAESMPDGIKVKMWSPGGEEISNVGFTSTEFIPSRESDLYAAWVETQEAHQGNGYARQLYEWTASLGNDIVAASVQEPPGKAMWSSFERQGIAKLNSAGSLSIKGNQRGGIDLVAIEEGLKKLKEPNVVGDPDKFSKYSESDIPTDPKAAGVIKLGLEDKVKSTPNRHTSAGSMLEAGKSNSSVIYHVGQIVQNFGKRAEQNIRTLVYPIENALNKYSEAQLVQGQLISKSEFKMGRYYTPEELVKLGLTPKEVTNHVAMQRVTEAAFNANNVSRQERGLPPTTREESLYAKSWRGDFGITIKNATGETVWTLTAQTKPGLILQTNKLLKKFPELSKGDNFENKNTDPNDNPYTTMVDILGRTKPDVLKIKEEVERGGGYEGDKAGIKSPGIDARQFYKSQISELKNTFKWIEINKAAPNLKEILNSPELIAQQPGVMAYSREYVQNALGFGEWQSIKNLEQAMLHGMGVSPEWVNGGLGSLKGFWVTSKLMASLGYSIANGYQVVNTIPHITDLYNKGYIGNPATTAVYGTMGGAVLGLGHITTKGGFVEYIKTSSLPEVVKAAMIYAERNSVTNRSVYDETGIGDYNSIAWRAAKATVTAPETLARSVAFMTFVGHLESSGQFSKARWNEMFQMAEERTNMAMGDSRKTEQAPIFSKLGIVGNSFNTLATYPMNWFNQINLFAREAWRGNPLPLFSMLVSQVAVAGTIGLPLVEDVHTLWEAFKKTLPTEQWNKVKDWNVKTALVKYGGGQTMAYGAPSVMSGQNMTSRLNAPTFQNSLTIPGGMAVDIFKTLHDISKAAVDYDDPHARAQAMLTAAPPGIKEFVAQDILTKYTQTEPDDKGNIGVFSKKHVGDYNRVRMYTRTPKEMSLAKYGIRTQKEVFESDLEYPLRMMSVDINKRRDALVDKIYAEMRTTQKMNPEHIKLYVALDGKDLNPGLKQRAQKEALDNLTRDVSKAGKSVNIAVQYQMIDKLLKDNGY